MYKFACVSAEVRPPMRAFARACASASLPAAPRWVVEACRVEDRRLVVRVQHRNAALQQIEPPPRLRVPVRLAHVQHARGVRTIRERFLPALNKFPGRVAVRACNQRFSLALASRAKVCDGRPG